MYICVYIYICMYVMYVYIHMMFECFVLMGVRPPSSTIAICSLELCAKKLCPQKNMLPHFSKGFKFQLATIEI